MAEYPKIETLYDRDEKFKVVIGQFRKPEFRLINQWLVTEKVDGTNIRIEFSLGVDGYADLRFKGRTDNAQMSTALYQYLQETFQPPLFDKAFERPITGTLYGEGYGPKIQKAGGNYRSDGPAFRLFDVQVGDWWLRWSDVEDVASKLGISTVPVLDMHSHIDAALALVSIPSSIPPLEEGNPELVQEGVVARTDPPLFDRKGLRVFWKLKGKDFA